MTEESTHLLIFTPEEFDLMRWTLDMHYQRIAKRRSKRNAPYRYQRPRKYCLLVHENDPLPTEPDVVPIVGWVHEDEMLVELSRNEVRFLSEALDNPKVAPRL